MTMFFYPNKFKFILIMSAIKLIDKYPQDFVKTFRLDLFNKTNEELDHILTSELYGLEKIYKHLNIAKR